MAEAEKKIKIPPSKIKLQHEFEYPLIVYGIKRSKGLSGFLGTSGKCGDVVSIRPCGEEYKNKTYTGIYLGDMIIDSLLYYDEENEDGEQLIISDYRNPAIFVPELKKVIWGCESWWGSSDGKEITDEDIQNSPAMLLLKAMIEKSEKDKEEENED